MFKIIDAIVSKGTIMNYISDSVLNIWKSLLTFYI